MLLALFVSLQSPSPALQDLVRKAGEAAAKRDVAALQALLPETEALGRRHLSVVRTNGAYDTGRFGWKALPLRHPDGREYLVLSTALTSEDIGDMVFEVQDGKPVRYLNELDPGGYRILRHKIQVRFDLPAKTAHLTNEIELEGDPSPKLPCLLRFSPNYQIERVEQDGRQVPFVQAGGVVLLPTAGSGVQKFRLTYSGKVDRPGYAGGIVEREASLTNDYWYPLLGRLPSAHEVAVTAPADWVAVGQGVKTGESVSGNLKTTRFRMDLPVVYFSLSVGKFQVRERTVNGKTYRVWAKNLTPAEMDHQIEFMEPVHRYFSTTFGIDHFKGFGALISEPYGGGALEAYSHATYGEGWLPDEDAHEPAHTWWGGQVNNTYLKSFWNESFAVFCEGLYARNSPIGNREDRAKAFVQRPELGGSGERYSLAEAGAWIGGPASELGYGKGGYVLQMLETHVGTDGMLKAMRRWLNQHPHMQPGEWEDFERHFLAENGASHKPFFDAWVRGTGSLRVSLADLAYRDRKLTGRVVQEGRQFPGTAEILTQDAQGKRAFHRIDLSDPTFSLPVAAKPKIVSLDPWLRLVRRIQSGEAPPSLAQTASRWRVWRHPKRSNWLPALRQGKVDALLQDWANTVVVAHPDDLPKMKDLCARAGFSVQGNTLTYKGTRVDLGKGGALALIDLPGGKRCAIGLGTSFYRPNTGHARTAVFDHLGRFLRGVSEPKTAGPLVYQVP